jgi:hypothetical protein
MRVSAHIAIAIVFALNVTPVYAQRGSAKPPDTNSSHAVKQSATKPSSTHGSKSQASTQGPSAKPSTASAGSQASAKGNAKPSSTPAKSKGSAEKTATATASNGTTIELTPVQLKLQKNTNLASKLQDRLPKGTNLMDAAADFRNLGQFVAAVNVSHNLNIDFDKLKADMVTKKMSLGQSIQDLKPASSAVVEAQRAEFEANQLIAQTETTTTATTTTTTQTKKKTTGQ